MVSVRRNAGCWHADEVVEPASLQLVRRRLSDPGREPLHLTHVLQRGGRAQVRLKVDFDLVFYDILVIERRPERGLGRGRDARDRGSDWANVGRRRR
jgi:hypothetical protein